MRITELLPNLLLIEPKVFEDHRGHFFESFREDVLRDHGLTVPFVQDNQSLSHRGILRGLHFQKTPHAQGKFVRVITGAVLDVALDIRKDSPTYGQFVAEELTASNKRMLYIPPGFAHGFVALKDSWFYYKCSKEYHGPSESGICWNDPALAINWGVADPVISEKDKLLPELNVLLSSGMI